MSPNEHTHMNSNKTANYNGKRNFACPGISIGELLKAP